jgi:hypothetical protein
MEGLSTSSSNLVALSSFPLAFSVTCRLTNGLFLALYLGYVLLFAREALVKVILYAGLGLAPLVAYSLGTSKVLFSTGSYTGQYGNLAQMVGRLWRGLPGVLISPGRGLFVYTPVFIFSIAGVFWHKGQEMWVFLLSFVGLVLSAATWFMWWGGGGYSYRIIVDIVPFLCVLLVPVWKRWRGHLLFRGAFVLAALLSCYVQVIGAYWFDYTWEIHRRIEYQHATGEEFTALREPFLWSIRDNPIAWYQRKFWVGQSTNPPRLTRARFSDQVELYGYELPRWPVSVEGKVNLVLHWRALGPTDRSYTVFTHVIDDSERIWGQVDSVPVQGASPTTGWRQGEFVRDEYFIPLDPETPAGEYWVAVGLYSLETMERLSVVNRRGEAEDTRVLLGPIHVQ